MESGTWYLRLAFSQMSPEIEDQHTPGCHRDPLRQHGLCKAQKNDPTVLLRPVALPFHARPLHILWMDILAIQYSMWCPFRVYSTVQSPKKTY